MKLKDYESKIHKLREEQDRFLELMHSIDKKLARGEITRYQKQFTINSITHGLQEHEYLRALEKEIQQCEGIIKSEHKHSPEFKNIIIISTSIIVAVILLVLLIIPGMIKAGNQSTKTFIMPLGNIYYAGESATIPLNINPEAPLTSLRINGSYKGDVKLYLVINNTGVKYIVFDSSHYAEDIVSITGNVFVIRGTPSPSGTSLTNVCEETCKLKIEPIIEEETVGLYLIVEIEESGMLKINDIKYTQLFENNPPEQVRQIKDIIIQDSTSISIDLSGYFSDRDDDILNYKLSNIPGIIGTTQDDTVTFKVPSGIDTTYSGFIYISDNKDTINSNVFKIIINTTKIVDNVTKNNVTSAPDDKRIPLDKTGNRINVSSNLTNNTAIRNNTLPNSSTNASVDINFTGGIGDTPLSEAEILRYVRGAAFSVDKRLVDMWTENPSASPRVLVRYNEGNNQNIESYLNVLEASMKREAELAPQNYDVNALNAKLKGLESKALLLRNGFTNPADDNNNLITGNVVAEDIYINNSGEVSKIIGEINTLKSMIDRAELYSEIKYRKEMESLIYSNESKIEALLLNFTNARMIMLNKDIKKIYLDDVVEPMMTESLDITNIPEAKLLGKGMLDGTNITICMLDTGVNLEYVQNAVDGYDFVNDDANYTDDNGHGTSVGYILYNIAPGSDLIVGKVLDENGTGYESTVIMGIDYCVAQNASIISMSIGSGGYNGYCDDNPVAQIIDGLNESVLVIAATGNDASNLVKAPSCARNALAVGASTKSDEVAEFTNFNGNTLLLAPGKDINTIDENGNAKAASGTSMSVPFITGISAMLTQSDKNITPRVLQERLIHTGQIITIINHTFSRVDAYNVLIYNVTNNLTPENINATINIVGNYTALTDCSGLDLNNYYDCQGTYASYTADCTTDGVCNVADCQAFCESYSPIYCCYWDGNSANYCGAYGMGGYASSTGVGSDYAIDCTNCVAYGGYGCDSGNSCCDGANACIVDQCTDCIANNSGTCHDAYDCCDMNWCVAGTCRDSLVSTYNGSGCSSDTIAWDDWGSAGVVALATNNRAGSWACTNYFVSYYSSYYYYNCYSSNITHSGDPCDVTVYYGSYSRDGACTNNTCCTSAIVSGEYTSPDFTGDSDNTCGCTYTPINKRAQICDNSATTGPTAEGSCVNTTCCTSYVNSGENRTVNLNWTDGDEKCGNCNMTVSWSSAPTICDTTPSDGLSGNGVCVGNVTGSCTRDEVVNWTGGYMWPGNCSAAGLGITCYDGTTPCPCDSNVSDGEYNQDGICAFNITLGRAICDTDLDVADNGTLAVSDCYMAYTAATPSRQCDSGVDTSYSANSICTVENFTTAPGRTLQNVNCDALNTETANQTWYKSDCYYADYNLTDNNMISNCDSTGGTLFTPNGWCSVDVVGNPSGVGDVSCMTSGEIANYSGLARSTCAFVPSTSINLCDSTGGMTFVPNGMCADGGCDVDTVSFATGTYYGACAAGRQCDSNVGSPTAGYTRDGYCATTSCATTVIVSGWNVSECGTMSGCLATDFTDGDEIPACSGSANEGAVCATNPGTGTSPAANGTCADATCRTSGIVSINCTGACDATDLDALGANVRYGCNSTYALACDSNINGSGFNQDGICVRNYTTGLNNVCATSGFVCLNDDLVPEYYYTSQNYSACNLCGYGCDSTITDGNYAMTGTTYNGSTCIASNSGASGSVCCWDGQCQSGLICIGGVSGTCNAAPTINTLTLNTTSIENTTRDNLTVTFTVSDSESNAIYNVTDWRRNGTSIAALNMPFNRNTTPYSGAVIKDYSTLNNNGTMMGGIVNPIWTSNGKVGGAYVFDGVNDYINTSKRGMSGTQGTIMFWVNPRSLNASILSAMDVAATGTYGCLFATSGAGTGLQYPFFYYGNGTVVISLAGTTILTAGTWRHMAATYSASGARLYQDGVLVNSSTMAPNISMSVYPGLIMGSHASTQRFFNGTLDEVKIFNRSLSSEQIYQEYSAGLNNRSTNILVRNETVLGDNWSVSVGACDIYHNCTTSLSNGVIINQALECGVTLRENSTNTMTENFSNFDGYWCLGIQGRNVTLNCNGYAFVNGTDSAIGVENARNISINNCTIKDTRGGIYIYNSTNVTINNTNFTGYIDNDLIAIQESSYVTVDRMVGNGSTWGLYVYVADYNTITNTVLTNTRIYLNRSNYNNISRVNITYSDATYHALIISNTSNNNRVTLSRINHTTSDRDCISLSTGSTNNTITNNTIIMGNDNNGIENIHCRDNKIYWNNFIYPSGATGAVITELNGTGSTYNTSVGGIAQGNNYSTINTIGVYDVNSDGWGETGTNYPLNSTTWSAYWSGNGSDWGPATTGIGCGVTLSTANRAYTLTQNMNISGATCFNIVATNVTINCNGYTLRGNNASSTYGIYTDTFNTTIINCNIANFSTGILFTGAMNGTIQNSNISTTYTQSGFDGRGIYMNSGADYNTISNTIANSTNGNGISFNDGSNNIIINSSAISNTYQGISLVYSSDNNQIINSTLASNAAEGISITSSLNNLIINSSATSRTVGFSLADSSNTTILRCNIIGNYSGGVVWIWANSQNNTIANSTINGLSGACAVSMTTGSRNNIFINNTILNATTLLHADSESGNNKIYWNNFTNTAGYYINNSNSTNTFNTSVGGISQGNIYYGINAKAVYDTNTNNWGDSGSDYPISATTWATKWSGPGSDWGPWTTRNVVCNAPATGNWDVDGNESCENQIIVLNGNLTANTSDKLMLQNITLVMNITASYIRNVYALNGGEIHANLSNINTSTASYYSYLDSSNGLINLTDTNATNRIIPRIYNLGKMYLSRNSRLSGETQITINNRSIVTMHRFLPGTLINMSAISTNTPFALVMNDSLIAAIGYMYVSDANVTFNLSTLTRIYVYTNNSYKVYFNHSATQQLYYTNFQSGMSVIDIRNWNPPKYNIYENLNTSGNHNLVLYNSNVTTIFAVTSYNPMNFTNTTLYNYYCYTGCSGTFNNSKVTTLAYIQGTNNIFQNSSLQTTSYTRPLPNTVMNFTQIGLNNYISRAYIVSGGVRAIDGYVNITSLYSDAWTAASFLHRYFPVNLTDNSGRPVPGATINLKNSTGSTISSGITSSAGISIINATDDRNTTQYQVFLGSEYKQNITMLYPTAPAGIQLNVTKATVSAVNLTPLTAYTDNNLIANVTCTDSVYTPLNVYWKVFRNNALQGGESGNMSITQGVSRNVKNVSNALTTVGQSWNVEFTCENNYTNSTAVNTSAVTILAPPTPSLYFPNNGNISIRTRQPTLIWNNSASATWYEVNITSNNCVGLYGNSTVLIGPTQSNYTPTTELCVQTEGTNTYYNWTVKSCNSEGCSAWTNKWNFTVEPYLSIIFVNNTIIFPTLLPTNKSNTTNVTDLTRTPFVFRNDGNVFANITNITTLNQTLWNATGAGLSTRYLQIQAAEKEAGSFNTTLSAVSWNNVSIVNNNTIRLLNYNNSKDEAYVHVLVEVPAQEPPGARTIFMIFNWISI